MINILFFSNLGDKNIELISILDNHFRVQFNLVLIIYLLNHHCPTQSKDN